jgi:hypothetical protein
MFYDFDGSVGAAIIHEHIFVVIVRLPQNALNAVSEKVLGIIERCQNADEWLIGFHSGRTLPQQANKGATLGDGNRA